MEPMPITDGHAIGCCPGTPPNSSDGGFRVRGRVNGVENADDVTVSHLRPDFVSTSSSASGNQRG
jgi:hypothetical protein